MKILKPSSMYTYTFGDMNSTLWAIWAAPGGEGFLFSIKLKYATFEGGVFMGKKTHFFQHFFLHHSVRTKSCLI